MKKSFILFLIMICISCGKEKVVLLPEINHSEITAIKDVSAAYLFYDETKPDSVELNRKNLISTTNWLINVDRRLTLKQIIPHIKFLQEKKRNSSHKNKNAKNYFTCNDTSRKNLGFLEFTDVVYSKKNIVNVLADNHSASKNKLIIYFETLENIKINSFFDAVNTTYSNIKDLNQNLIALSKNKNVSLELCFNKNLTFRDYISIQSVLSQIKNEHIKISNNEAISN